MSTLLPPIPSSPLLKQTVAATLRDNIVSGLIAPGQAIIERKWAAQLGVAQGSVREAINILAAEGFVQKTPGRRARVTKLTREDALEVYRVRSVLEGLAARLVVERQADTDSIGAACEDMKRALASNHAGELIDADLRFHLALCEQSGNKFLLEHARRLLVPLFAFVRMSVRTHHGDSQPWLSTMGLHRQILDVLRLDNPFVAEQFVMQATNSFATAAYDAWQSKAEHPPEG